MNKDKANKIFKRFLEQNPHPVTELKYNSAFELLIAVMLSAQATDVSVNKATLGLFNLANTPQAILNIGIDVLKGFIKSIGLYNSKAQHILKTCQLLIERHQGQVPHDRQSLESLPGVGRKTANVVLNTMFGQATIAVDTHIFRVANRTGLAVGSTPLAVELGLLETVAPEFLQNAHHWLVLHGRYVCTARKPHCSTCIISDLCEYKNKNWVE
ncbi:MAG: endonuclease III [Legionella sp.]|nr:endonuclease III [Legionella sp.]